MSHARERKVVENMDYVHHRSIEASTTQQYVASRVLDDRQLSNDEIFMCQGGTFVAFIAVDEKPLATEGVTVPHVNMCIGSGIQLSR